MTTSNLKYVLVEVGDLLGGSNGDAKVCEVEK